MLETSSDDSDDSIHIIPTTTTAQRQAAMEDVSSDSFNEIPVISQAPKRTRTGRTRLTNQNANTRERPTRTRSRLPQKEEEKNDETENKIENKPPAPPMVPVNTEKRPIVKRSRRNISHVKEEEDEEESYEEEKIEKKPKKRVKRRSIEKENEEKVEEVANNDSIKGEIGDVDEKVTVAIPQPPPIVETTYAITRTNKVSLKGSSYTFHFLKQDNIIYSSKCKGRNPSKPMPIVAGEEVHLSKPGDFYLIPEKSSTIFELRKESITGPLISTSHIMHNVHNLMMPRTVMISITEESGLPTTTLITRKPKLNRNGTFTLHFHNRFTIPSEKNAIFINQALGTNGPDVLSIRKIGKATLEIISDVKIPDYLVFAIGLTMFTGNLDN